MESVQELAHYFVHQITQASVGIEARFKAACASIEKLVKDGWTLDEIKHELDQFAREYPFRITSVYHVEEIMSNKIPPDNLMEPDVFYYHHQLRIVSPPVRIVRDPDTGKMVRKSEPFYLEMKKRFTMQDLLDYWYQEMNITPTESTINRDKGGFKHLLKDYTIDEILFAIDNSKTIRQEQEVRLLRNPLDLSKYMCEAKDSIKLAENQHKMQGINREFKRISNE